MLAAIEFNADQSFRFQQIGWVFANPFWLAFAAFMR